MSTPAPLIRILITGFRPIVLYGLEMLVQSNKTNMEIVSIKTSPEEAIADFKVTLPDIVLIEMVLMSQSAVVMLMQQFKALMPNIRILVLCDSLEKTIHENLVEAGAHGVIDKLSSIDIILKAIEKVVLGQLWLDRDSLGRIIQKQKFSESLPAISLEKLRFDSLTPREKEIIMELSRYSELKVKAIAEKMRINEQTLRNHLTSIYDKLDVTNRLELYVYVQKLGLEKNSLDLV